MLAINLITVTLRQLIELVGVLALMLMLTAVTVWLLAEFDKWRLL